MKKYRKIILITYIILAILMVVAIKFRSVKREMRTDIDITTQTRIFDKADLFNDDEEKKLEKQLRAVVKSEKTDIAIVTTANAEGKEAQKYAEDFYIEHGLGYDKEKGTGIILLIDMDTSMTGKRKIWISGCGDAKSCINNEVATKISNAIKKECGKGEYYLASSKFLSEAKIYMNKSAAVPKFIDNSFVLLIISLVGTAIVVFIKVKNFGMKVTTNASTYLNRDSVKTNSKRDDYLGTTVTTRIIEHDNNSGGSSGGGSSDFSGGGADF